MLCQRHDVLTVPLLQHAWPRASRRELTREETHHRHAIARINSLVHLPRSAKEVVDRSRRTRVPTNGKLSPLPLEPQHEFLRGSRGRVALCVAEDEVEADVALR